MKKKSVYQKNLITVMGPPRSGKTTISKLLRQKLKYDYVSFSEIRMQQTGGKPKFTTQEFANAYEESAQRVKQAILLNRDVIWDACFTSDEARQKIKNILGLLTKEYRYFPIVLRASPKVIYKRIVDTFSKHTDKDVTPERAESLATGYPEFPGGHEFDTSRSSPKQTVENILALIKNHQNS